MSSENHGIGKKLQMFTNLLFHIDDYIKNKKERKGQLNVPKNMRLVLREVISSLVNLSFFINNKIISSDDIEKKSDEEIKRQKIYIKIINPLSFNQKNLNNINLFYNTDNEIFIINYFIVEKLFYILRYCLLEVIKKKNVEYGKTIFKNNNDLVLNKIKFDDLAFDDDTSEQNMLRKMLKKKYIIEKAQHQPKKMKLAKIKINNIKKYNNDIRAVKNPTINVSKLISNNYNINNISDKLTKVTIRKDHEINKTNENYLKHQIRRINKDNVPIMKSDNIQTFRTLKNTMSLPLIYDKKILNFKMSNYYKRERKKILSKIDPLDKSKKSKEKNKYSTEKLFDNKNIPNYKKIIKGKFYIKSRNSIFKK